MKEKKSVTIVLLLLLCCSCFTKAQTDAYGGWTTIKAPATGFFSLAEINGRHTFVTPDGHAYYPLGTNHMSAYNNENYRQVAAFQDENLALKRLKEDITYFNMNAAGGDVPAIVKEHLPFFTTIHLTTNAHWLPARRFEFQDVFDASFISQLKDNIQKKCLEHRDNKFLIGYYWTDTPRWDVVISRNRHLKDWVSYLRNLDGQAAGKRAYVAFLEQKYTTIEQFNRTYGLDFTDLEAVRNGRFDHIDFHQPYVIADDTEFLGVIAEHLYRITFETIKKYDPNHLILGEKYIAGDHPKSVLRAATKYVDVISIQPGPAKGPGPGYGKEESEFNVEGFNHLYRITEKPIMICDHTVSFYTRKYPVTLWHQFASQQLAGEAQSDFILQAAKTPYILGYMNCQYLDTYDSSRGLLKQGLLDKNGQRHQSYADLIKQANAAVLGLVRSQLGD